MSQLTDSLTPNPHSRRYTPAHLAAIAHVNSVKLGKKDKVRLTNVLNELAV